MLVHPKHTVVCPSWAGADMGVTNSESPEKATGPQKRGEPRKENQRIKYSSEYGF